ncbi:hypothetical protein [Bacteroides sp. 224]|uniref:hypothetical protein n=1 Tax=Bacteroides sp. 224 TaxID=2302936 RepID=UPI0013D18F23|nr:hypothetical protein [Bacteroides sp. 224]NDV66410.1 hypothetical protein [Bacteroides sp. 224]
MKLRNLLVALLGVALIAGYSCSSGGDSSEFPENPQTPEAPETPETPEKQEPDLPSFPIETIRGKWNVINTKTLPLIGFFEVTDNNYLVVGQAIGKTNIFDKYNKYIFSKYTIAEVDKNKIILATNRSKTGYALTLQDENSGEFLTPAGVAYQVERDRTVEHPTDSTKRLSGVWRIDKITDGSQEFPVDERSYLQFTTGMNFDIHYYPDSDTKEGKHHNIRGYWEYLSYNVIKFTDPDSIDFSHLYLAEIKNLSEKALVIRIDRIFGYARTEMLYCTKIKD